MLSLTDKVSIDVLTPIGDLVCSRNNFIDPNKYSVCEYLYRLLYAKSEFFVRVPRLIKKTQDFIVF